MGVEIEYYPGAAEEKINYEYRQCMGISFVLESLYHQNIDSQIYGNENGRLVRGSVGGHWASFNDTVYYGSRHLCVDRMSAAMMDTFGTRGCRNGLSWGRKEG